MTADPERVTEHSSPCRRDDLASVEVENETIIYDPAAEMLHHLDRIATLVWRELDGQVSVGGLAHDLADVFEAERDTVIADVLQLVRQFAKDGLLASSGEAP